MAKPFACWPTLTSQPLSEGLTRLTGSAQPSPTRAAQLARPQSLPPPPRPAAERCDRGSATAYSGVGAPDKRNAPDGARQEPHPGARERAIRCDRRRPSAGRSGRREHRRSEQLLGNHDPVRELAGHAVDRARLPALTRAGGSIAWPHAPTGGDHAPHKGVAIQVVPHLTQGLVGGAPAQVLRPIQHACSPVPQAQRVRDACRNGGHPLLHASTSPSDRCAS